MCIQVSAERRVLGAGLETEIQGQVEESRKWKEKIKRGGREREKEDGKSKKRKGKRGKKREKEENKLK